MPWRWHGLSLEAALGSYLGLARVSQVMLSLRDFATNLAIFVLLALLWSACQGRSLRPMPRPLRIATVLAGSCLLSAGIEFAQLFFDERTSSIYDLAANTLGAALGAWLWHEAEPRLVPVIAAVLGRHRSHPVGTRRSRRIVIMLAPVYAVALGAANHWLSLPWLGMAEAARRAPEISFLPFYYYQEASTVVAVVGALGQMLLYAPLGAGLRTLSAAATGAGRLRPQAVAAIGAGVACAMEGGRLFLPGQHPDLGNVVVAALGAAAGFVAWPAACGTVLEAAAPLRRGRAPVPAGVARTPAPLAVRGLSICLFLIVGATLLRFPVAPGALAIAYLLYAGALMRWPRAWLWVLPAALPVLDLAPLSGWFMFDEFDLAVLVTAAALLWRPAAASRKWPISGIALGLWGAFAVSVALSALLGLLPLQAIDANAFASYFSHYNALRIAKGFVWAFLLIWLLQRAGHEPAEAAGALTGGILVGLAGATVFAIWERLVFPGLLNFSQDYRVGAFFSSMHTGGSDIEAYVVMTAPFLLVAAWVTSSALLRLACGGLFLAATYVLMVTYARGGYGAFLASMALAIGVFWRVGRVSGNRRILGWLVVAAGSAAAVAGVVVAGSFAQAAPGCFVGGPRRCVPAHSQGPEVLDPVDRRHPGNGPGALYRDLLFPQHRWRLPATFRYGADSEGGLRLGSGDTVYVEQFVAVRPQRSYRLSLNLVSPAVRPA